MSDLARSSPGQRGGGGNNTSGVGNNITNTTFPYVPSSAPNGADEAENEWRKRELTYRNMDAASDGQQQQEGPDGATAVGSDILDSKKHSLRYVFTVQSSSVSFHGKIHFCFFSDWRSPTS